MRTPCASRGVDQAPGLVDPVRLGEGRADLMSLCEEHRVGHAAAEQQRVDTAEQMLEHGELVGNLRAAQDSDEGSLGIVQEPREHRFLALEEQPRVARQQLRHADSRGMGAVSGAESVVDEEIAEPGQAGGELRIVGFLAGLEARVLEEQDIAGVEGARRAFRLGTGDNGDRGNVLPEQLAQPSRDWSHGIGGIRLPLRPPQVRCQHDRRASVQQIPNRR